MEKNDIPVIEGKCGTHNCAAVRHIEDVSHDLDVLRAELRRSEKDHAEDIRKLWYRIGIMIMALAAAVPSGWAVFLGVI